MLIKYFKYISTLFYRLYWVRQRCFFSFQWPRYGNHGARLRCLRWFLIFFFYTIIGKVRSSANSRTLVIPGQSSQQPGGKKINFFNWIYFIDVSYAFISFNICNFPHFPVGPASTASPTSVADGRLTTAFSVTKPREYVVNRASFRLSDLEKNRCRIQKKHKLNLENWICFFCCRDLQEDEENGEGIGRNAISVNLRCTMIVFPVVTYMRHHLPVKVNNTSNVSSV